MEAELVVEGRAGGATESRGGAEPAGAGTTSGAAGCRGQVRRELCGPR